MASKPSNPKEKKDKPAKGGKPVAKKKAPTPTAKPVKTPRKAVKQASPTPTKKKPIAGTSQEAAARKVILFIDAYLSNGNNATQAAITAGYSEKTARAAGCRLLTRVDVKQAIAERSQKVAEKLGLNLERTLQEIARLAYADPRKMFNEDGSLKGIHELDDDTAATVASIEVEEEFDFPDEKDEELEAQAHGGALKRTKGKMVASGRTVKVKQWDKRAALDMAMKFHGAYEQDNKQRQPITMQVAPVDEDL